MDESDELSPDTIAEDANLPASASQDGRAATAVPIPDKIAADKYQKASAALEGQNANGGPKSGWGATRPAVARFKGGT